MGGLVARLRRGARRIANAVRGRGSSRLSGALQRAASATAGARQAAAASGRRSSAASRSGGRGG